MEGVAILSSAKRNSRQHLCPQASVLQNANYSQSTCNATPQPNLFGYLFWFLRVFTLHIYVIFAVLTHEFLSFQRRSTRLLQVLSWGRCSSLALSSAELIICSQHGLGQLSRSHCRVAVHGPERLSGITGVCGVSIQSSALSIMA